MTTRPKAHETRQAATPSGMIWREGRSPGPFLEDEATGAPTDLPRPGSMEASENGSTTFAKVLAPGLGRISPERDERGRGGRFP